MNDLQHIIDNISLFKHLYDGLRIVDPIRKKVVYYDEKNIEITEVSCYDFWEKGEHCANCVSIRAYTEGDSCVKVEYNGNKIFLVMATPLEYNDNKYVFETFKDITRTGIVQDVENKSQQDILKYIKGINDRVVKDELTGIYNRRYINDKLPVEIFAVSVTRKASTAIMFDIDNFKKINDEYGHILGDYLLKEFTKILQEKIKNTQGWVGRYGGEEFFVLLQGLHKEEAYILAEDMRRTIEDTSFFYKGVEIKFTISGGIYEIQGIENFEEVLEMADNKLYEAKGSGKNCIKN